METGRLTVLQRTKEGHGMKLRISISVLLAVLLAASHLGSSSTTVPRTSPELVINQPSGKTTLLSSFKGKVVMLEFLFLRSPKCLELAETMNRLHSEFAARGFQPVAIAFPAPQSDANAALVDSMANYLKLTYPVGYSNKEAVDQYLGRGERDLLRIPQVVIIDRNGIVRAQTGMDNPQLENENSLRALIEGLLKEGAAGSTAKR
jgi:peroxiredoxin